MATVSSNAWSSALDGGADTIVARATAPGRGALAVVRVSGSQTVRAAATVCPGLDCDRPWHAQLVEVRDAEGRPIERVVAIPYRKPRSYTGEDMVELVLHGSGYLVETAIAAWCAAGARQARPGEFTRRAVANGKMDLVQAEAVADLIAADTAEQANLARRQLIGDLSTRFLEVHRDLIDLLARVEACLDFDGDDLAVDDEDMERRRCRCVQQLSELLATARGGRMIRDGVRVVILGPPNAGKSSLFNYLVGGERAIVAEQAGTTRDVLEAEIDVAGVPVVMVDTAGLREAEGAVEVEGVRRAKAAVAQADAAVVLWPVDGGEPDEGLVATEHLPTLKIRSKVDLGEQQMDQGWFRLSIVSGEGLHEINRELERIVFENVDDRGGQVAVNRRHQERLRTALNELEACRFDELELAAESLRGALTQLGEVLGFEMSEAILDRVFATFCIGK